MSTTGPDEHPRRRHRRASAARDAPPPPEKPAPPARDAPKNAQRRRPGRDQGERGLRDLVGAGPSQLGLSGALRARAVNQPSEADLAQAEAETTIVRRHWHPPGEGKA